MVVTRDFREEDRDIMNGYKVAVLQHINSWMVVMWQNKVNILNTKAIKNLKIVKMVTFM